MDEVSGTVRYDDGSLVPSQAIIVRFEPLAAPLDEKTHPKAGMAKVNPADGSFDSVTTYKYGDGIVRGEHKVLVSERLADPTAQESNAKPLIPEEYRDAARTPLTVDSRESPFEIRIPKPK